MKDISLYKCRLVPDGVLTVSDSVCPTLDCEEAAAELLYYILRDLPHEEVWALFVNGRSEIVGAAKLAQGGLHGCSLTARDVLAPAVAANASALILGHNHPSGDPTPSHDDWEMTKHIAKCCDLIGIPLLDHLVVCPSKRLSRSCHNGIDTKISKARSELERALEGG